MSVTVANTAANLSGDTLVTAENAETLTGQKTFSNTILFSPDNTYDIGATGANRPRDVFIADDLTVGDDVTIGGDTTMTGTLGVTGGISVASLLNGTFTVVSSTSTGSQNNWAPGLVGNTCVLWTGASNAAITGIAGGRSGQIVTILNQTSNIITFAHQSGSSSAGNKFTNLVTSAATPVGSGGRITYIYSDPVWNVIEHDQGAWITPTFAAGDFTAFAAGTWTVASGDIGVCKYYINGKTLHWNISVNTSTVARSGADPTILIVASNQYGAFTRTNHFISPAFTNDNGTTSIGYVTGAAGGANAQFILVNGAQWANATDATGVYWLGAFEVT